jgi:hypothetical protein
MQSGGIETIKVALPSMQSLFLELRFNGQPLSTATGFIVEKESKPLLVTNRHVVTGRHNTTGKPLSTTGGLPNEVAILHNRKGRIGEWVWRLEALLDGDAPKWTEHPTLASKMDCVVLPLANFEDVEFYPYSLEEPTHKLKLGPAETISVVGFPFGLRSHGAFAIWATGFIATETGVDHEQLPQFLIDCRSRPGQSGSPVIAHRPGGMTPLLQERTFATTPLTELLGVYSGRINDESDLGIVWKKGALRDVVDNVQI